MRAVFWRNPNPSGVLHLLLPSFLRLSLSVSMFAPETAQPAYACVCVQVRRSWRRDASWNLVWRLTASEAQAQRHQRKEKRGAKEGVKDGNPLSVALSFFVTGCQRQQRPDHSILRLQPRAWASLPHLSPSKRRRASQTKRATHCLPLPYPCLPLPVLLFLTKRASG